jgi:hypothetical protein
VRIHVVALLPTPHEPSPQGMVAVAWLLGIGDPALLIGMGKTTGQALSLVFMQARGLVSATAPARN